MFYYRMLSIVPCAIQEDFFKWSFYKFKKKKKIIETKPQTDWLNCRLNLAKDKIRNYPEYSTEREGDAKYEGEV